VRIYRTRLALCLFLTSQCFGQAWSGILTTARAADWTYAGIPGGVPSGSWANCVTAACNTAFASPSVANVKTACAGAPNNTVVRIPAGTFTWSTSVFCTRSNIALRGAGPQQTFITLGAGASIYMSSQGSGGQGPYPTGVGHTNWTGGLAQGSTVLTVASTTNVSAGQTVILTQQNASYVFPDGVEGTCISGNSCGVDVTGNQFNGAEAWAQIQEVSIVSVDSSTQITIAAPGVGFTASAGLSPVLFFWNTPHNAQFDGVENMTVNVSDNDHAISLPFCDYCWVKNVALTNATNRGSIFFYFGYRDEVRDSYVGGDTGLGHPTQYGIEFLETTFGKIENDILMDITDPIMTEGSYGTVLGYNYMRRILADNMFTSATHHLSHAFGQLWEGNVGGNLQYDNSWGSSSQNTAFRNYINGHDLNSTNFRRPIQVNAHNRYMNLVGNVLGDPTYHVAYVCDQTHLLGSDNFIYDIGFWDACSTIDGTNPYDTVSESSLMRWGNWDAVTYCTNGGHSGTACGATGSNGIRFCTGSGAGNAACTADETASADATFPGLASPGTSFPASFYNNTAGRSASKRCQTFDLRHVFQGIRSIKHALSSPQSL
jgi:hypothetical protein